ncbi:type-F conjugative transfer system pilin assembly protein TrbC [Candidatus Accumulibacter phosphatis]|uniref:Type-F conjugative transfer system pilin assembly protein TrbC n=1 Tax=Candidatus Accumulibacter contiguus TaxID=2954381 RepID=A0ABX1TBJ6_9PROT|nr:type-F conjugative transfer system pilin assembly protein TrbC [Candidatus Accumulibacter contiguus]NMQ06331.1 type-F conjugative transfer system pilin assembly protein TrbC [Candidatus Accumulibacter contiguus]
MSKSLVRASFRAMFLATAWGLTLTPAFAQVAPVPQAELQSARERMAATLKAIDGAGTSSLSVVPELRKLPQPAASAPDLAALAQAHRPSVPGGNSANPDVPELMVFVSFSLPRETLQRIVHQSERSGAVLVLRGLKGHSLTQTGEEIARLVGERNVTVLIHPPAFQQFQVRQVPSLVLARSGSAAKIDEDGCAPAASFIRIDGDVGQDYALDLIERQAPAWADIARRHAARLEGPRP